MLFRWNCIFFLLKGRIIFFNFPQERQERGLVRKISKMCYTNIAVSYWVKNYDVVFEFSTTYYFICSWKNPNHWKMGNLKDILQKHKHVEIKPLSIWLHYRVSIVKSTLDSKIGKPENVSPHNCPAIMFRPIDFFYPTVSDWEKIDGKRRKIRNGCK